jgi:DNA-binding transcriptional LysR family regulator
MRNLQGLASFVESALGGSFTAAAARLNVTPAAVGKNVMRLEQELQVRLFNRSTRRLKLTPEGEAFLAEAGEALRALDQAVDNVTRAGTEPGGRVRLSAGVTFGRRFVLPVLARLARQHPQLQFELGVESREVDLIGEGIDIAIRGALLPDSTLVARPICRLHSVLVASPGYLRKHGVPKLPGDLLQGHRLLALRFASGQVPSWRFRKPSGRGLLEFEPPAQLWTSDPESFLELAAGGEGICPAGLLYAAPMLRSGRLRLVLHEHHDAGERQISLCYPSRKFLSQRVRVAVEALLEGLAGQPDLQLDAAQLPAAWRAESV